MNLLDSASVVTAKPCEISAVRQAGGSGETSPIRLSFFCAGVPSQKSTSLLKSALIGNSARVTNLRYRGFGWPGGFYVKSDIGEEGYMAYSDSWGKYLNQTLQWRCKICPDGVGDSADIAGADYWDSDEQGWPILEERPGQTLLIAKTARGAKVVAAAQEAGFLNIESVDLKRFPLVQRYQVNRRRTVAARVFGARLGGRSVPKYVGYGLGWKFVMNFKESVRTVAGTYRRVRRSGYTEM
ncbi:Coenzyme F420 hydrogenase/dehydrogenase, beta subunit C-terminal domain [Rhodococcus sp. RS1C4]|nr:Coenzyme F420 hydrogenase/dehydrogenase, beta subunit C-terminal domain [Rhodococcus sp. RS1C4]